MRVLRNCEKTCGDDQISGAIDFRLRLLTINCRLSILLGTLALGFECASENAQMAAACAPTLTTKMR
jgi:hypothetical protein